MAFRVSNIEPIDLQPRVAIGISLPFNGSIGFNSTYTTADQLKTNILSFLLTNRGERLFQPTFGASLRNFIFEQISNNTIEDLNEIFKSKIEQQFPRVRVFDVVINADPDVNTINISFTYRVTQTNIEDNISITFE
jgi:phage baseplate assembly protein W